jgi:hypothetical protein
LQTRVKTDPPLRIGRIRLISLGDNRFRQQDETWAQLSIEAAGYAEAQERRATLVKQRGRRSFSRLGSRPETP